MGHFVLLRLQHWGGGRQSFPPIGIQRRGGHIFQTLLGLLFVLFLLLLPRPPHWCEGGGNYWGGGGQSFPPIGIQRRGGHIFQTLLGLLLVLFLLVFRLLLLQRRGGYFRTLLLLLVLLLPLLPSLKFSRKNDYNSDGTYMTGADGCFQRF